MDKITINREDGKTFVMEALDYKIEGQLLILDPNSRRRTRVYVLNNEVHSVQIDKDHDNEMGSRSDSPQPKKAQPKVQAKAQVDEPANQTDA